MSLFHSFYVSFSKLADYNKQYDSNVGNMYRTIVIS
jgi:hypothetical protein